MSSALTLELKGTQLKTNAKSDQYSSSQIIAPVPRHQSCCDTCVNWIFDIFPSNSIISFLFNGLTRLYDVLTILISIADVATDIWVIYNYKIEKRNTFFIISLIILIVAQLSYVIAFMLRFQQDGSKNCKQMTLRYIGLISILLPLAPFMSFIFYLLSFEHVKNTFYHYTSRCGFYDHFNINTSDDQAKITVWLNKKLKIHMGFILEGTASICFCFSLLSISCDYIVVYQLFFSIG